MNASCPCEPGPGLSLAATLNGNCRCVILDEHALARCLQAALPEGGFAEQLRSSHPTLFSPTAVFLSREQLEQLRSIVRATEQVIATAAYRNRISSWADPIAQPDQGARGVFLGYDFHLGEQGAKLIEINTNAGGALLNVVLARAARSCCPDTMLLAGGSDASSLEGDFIDMFHREWHLQRAGRPLRTVAIVDDDPPGQYLYPEFQLFQRLFERHGLQALIVEAAELVLRNGVLQHEGVPIDLVYNRLTDFRLTDPRHAVLRAAYETGASVVTPHPRAYALYADKRNLTVLSDAAFVDSLHLAPASRAALAGGIPATALVTPDNAASFWAQRRDWFFKPATGFGSRAAYRGDKLTRRVFEQIAQSSREGGYIAQARIDPSLRAHPYEPDSLKYDIRCYVYAGRIQLIAARLYQGQTTNFRTPGGGFAPVFVERESAAASGPPPSP